MKITFDESDDKFRDFCENNKEGMLIPDKGSYSLNFRVLDPIKANAFLTQFIYNNKDLLRDDAGIFITSTNLYTAISPNQIIDQLQNVIDNMRAEIERLS